MNELNNNLKHDFNLLKLLEQDFIKNQDKLYNAGGRWSGLPKILLDIINTIDLRDFRQVPELMQYIHDGNFIVESINIKKPNLFKKLFYNLFIKERLLVQKKRTQQLETYLNNFLKEHYKSSQTFLNLIKEYNIENTNIIKTNNFFVHDNTEYSINYIEELNRFDLVYKNTNLKNINTMVEIGGGFGSSIHIHLQNLKKLKKILLIDIFPIIYLSSQYLKFFYGSAVKDYSHFKNGKIKFQDNDDIEIICIPPWKIKDFEGKADYFYNSYSFVEMDNTTLKFYIYFLNRVLNYKKIISLVTYDKQSDKNLVLKDFLNLFEVQFLEKKNPVLWSHHYPKKRDNIYFLYDNF